LTSCNLAIFCSSGGSIGWDGPCGTLVTLIDQLRDGNIGFRSVCDGAIDTTTPSGELIFHVFSAQAQFERRLIQERTNAGLAAARIRGRKGGRPPIGPNDRRIVLATKLFQDKSIGLDDICATLKISKSTLYRYVVIGGVDPKSAIKRQCSREESKGS
jgi:DNA invertase Pin-like site-specific DNA recombinase